MQVYLKNGHQGDKDKKRANKVPHNSPHIPYVIKINTTNAEFQNTQCNTKQPTYYFKIGVLKIIITEPDDEAATCDRWRNRNGHVAGISYAHGNRNKIKEGFNSTLHV